MALFGDTQFHGKLIFKYVAFEGYVHFRQAQFLSGLDLEYANIEKEINFFGVSGLDSKMSIMVTSQETYRLIKHQFQIVEIL